MGFLLYFLIFVFILNSLLLILIVLIQKGRGGGLSGAFGGGMGGTAAFGAKTGDVLTWATSIIFVVFMLLAIGLNLLTLRMNGHSPAVMPETRTTPHVPPPTGVSPGAVPREEGPWAPAPADPAR